MLGEEWDLSQPGLQARRHAAAAAAAGKGWRWTAEMEEIAAAMAAPDYRQDSARRPRTSSAVIRGRARADGGKEASSAESPLNTSRPMRAKG